MKSEAAPAAPSIPSYAAAKPPNERDRLDALRSYGILDTDTEPAFDDLTRLASAICQTPISVINLVDRQRQWFKSEVGLGTRELPLHESICAHAILQPGLMEVPDTLEDARFNCNPLVTGAPHLRFYAGALLQTSDGHALGTLCVLDYKPKCLTPEQREALAILARQAMAQLELRKSLAAIKKAAGYRAQLMAIAGHDLRQPLQVVSMTMGAMAAKLPDADRKLVQMGNRALQALSADLSELARASQLDYSDAVEFEAVAVQPLMQGVADTWAMLAEKEGLKLKVASSKVVLRSNRTLLITILGNLVGNAIKYTDSGTVLVGCRKRDGIFSLEVWDSGLGIPSHQMEAIFEAFTQLDSNSEGLGLGLSIVRQSAETLGHRLDVRSWPGKGSCFSVQISPQPFDQAA